jgi:CheY-like chemotaxis protein
MSQSRYLFKIVLAAMIFGAMTAPCCAPVRAQSEEDPFATEEDADAADSPAEDMSAEEAAGDAGPAADAAVPAPPARAAAAASTPAATDNAVPVVETDPAVLTALEIPRKTPVEHFQAITWLLDLGRPELAKPILNDLTKLQMTDAQRAELVTRFGSRSMLQLAEAKELAPVGAQFADACMKAVAAATSDPKRVAALVAQLADPSPELRLTARNDLSAIGQAGVNATLEAMGRETDPTRRAAFASAARLMTPLVDAPLVAMLDTHDPALQSTVSALLESLAVRPAVPLLPQSTGSAESRLVNALSDYRRGMLPFAADANNQIELWHWDDATKKLTAQKYPVDEARTIWMARLARELTRYSPGNSEYVRQALLLELEAAALTGNAKSPALTELQAASLTDLDQILAKALAANYAHAAVAAIHAIADRGFDSVLYAYSSDGRSAPLARALRHPSRDVRFAALRAIMKLDPKSPYPDSSRVPEALAWFAASTGERRAVVAMPTAAAATDLAGMLAAEGLDASASNRGREAVDLALAMPDLEMIFVDVNINGPDIREVVYELRASPTTAEVPIAILAPNIRMPAAERIASEHTRVIAVPRVFSPEILKPLVARLTALSGRFATPPNVRAAQAVDALTWLSTLSGGERPFYKIRRTEPVIEAALYRADAAKSAITALGKLGTAESQSSLVDFASQATLPLESRSQAAEAFRASVAAHGVLLTNDQILTQYDRYNASETADADTQRVLGLLLDAIESRRDRQPLPPAPRPLPSSQ